MLDHQDFKTMTATSQSNTVQLPSFYSPRSRAHNGPESDRNIDIADLNAGSCAQAPLTERNDDGAFTRSSTPSTNLAPPPPASLLSPIFTPPSAPGTPAINSSESTVVARPLPSPFAIEPEPRGVPVDSSIPDGGCGDKHPRLLATLPRVRCRVRARIPLTTGAEMWLHLYENDADNKEHMAIVFGPNIRSRSLDAVQDGETEWDRLVRGAYTGRLFPGRTTSGFGAEAEVHQFEDGRRDKGQAEIAQTNKLSPLVRIHSECYTGETVWSARCDCGEQLDEAARLMSLPTNKAGGIIIYLRQEGRGIGLGEKLKAYNLQDLGNDTVEANLLLRHPADARSYGLATSILQDLGQKSVRLLTNNPDKIRAVEGPNREIVVTERVAMVPLSWKGIGGFKAPEVDKYLRTKIEKMGHMLPGDLAAPKPALP